jgi:hypothetical protein
LHPEKKNQGRDEREFDMNLEKKKRTPNLKTFEAKHVGVGEVNALEQELGNAILCHEPVASFGNSKQMK